MRKTYGIVLKRMMGIIMSISLLLSLTMCETDYCNENMFVVGTMKAFLKKSKAPLMVMTATNNSEGDTTFISPSGGLAGYFSLNPESDTSRFLVFTLDTFQLGKIAIVHRNRNEFVNAECGVRTLSVIDTVLIEDAVEGDSVAIKMRDVDANYDNENIEIYFAGFE